jgi:hypothetical protein
MLSGLGVCKPRLLGETRNGVNGSDHDFASMINKAAVLEDLGEIASGMQNFTSSLPKVHVM